MLCVHTESDLLVCGFFGVSAFGDGKQHTSVVLICMHGHMNETLLVETLSKKQLTDIFLVLNIYHWFIIFI